MHHAHVADSGRHSARPPSRISKFLTVGVAVAGAAAIAATPVSPVVDDIKVYAQTEQRAVALTAAADPLVVFQQFIAETLLNSGYLGSNATNAYAAVASAFADADLFGEFSDILVGNLSNPMPLLTRLSQFGVVYGDDLQIAFFGRDDDPTTPDNEAYDGVFDRYQLAGAEFQALLADLQNYDPPTTDPTQGPLTNMAFELNSFFVFGVLDNLRPLIGATPAGIVPLFSIPGDFLGGEVAGGFEGALPGFDRLDNLINVLNEQTFVRAAVGPFQTAFFQVAESLDDALAAYEEGDTELALNELTNLSLRTVNAFVNGFAPSFSPGGEEWPSLIDPRQQQAGLFKYLAVDLPNQLITALGGTPYVPQLPPAPTSPGARTNALLAAAAAPENTVTTAPELPAGASADDTTKLVSDTSVDDTTVGGADEIVEETKEDTKVTPGKVSYKPGDGLKALKKAGDDFNKSVKSFFTPKKKGSDKGADTGTTGGTTGGEAGGDKDNAGGDTDK